MPEKRKSAFIRATQEAQAPSPVQQTTVTPLDSETVTRPNRETVQQQEPSTGQKRGKKKVSFYLDQEQEDKLDALELQFRQHKKKINRNDIVRYLIDRCDSDQLLRELAP